MWDINGYLLNVFYNLDDLVLAFSLSLVTVYVCDFLRGLVLYHDSHLQLDAMPRYTAAEVLGTFESTFIFFEINFIILDVFGIAMYVLAMFTFMCWQTLRLPEYQCQANPLNVIVKHVQALDVIEQRRSERRDPDDENENEERSLYKRFDFTLIMLWAQGVGSCIAYWYTVYGVWKYANYWKVWKMTNYHVHRYRTANEWQSSMKEGPIPAALAECFFSCLQYLWPIYVKYRHFDGYSAVIIKDMGRAAFAGMGAWYSGGYYNPIMATALEITTQDYSILTIIFVYWLAPLLGTGIGFLLGEIS